MTMARSAPSSAARFVWRMECSVELAPVPAMKALSLGMASRAAARTWSRSASESIGNSPVEPSTTYPARAVAFHFRRFAWSPSTATSSPRNGVVTGTKTPSRSRMGGPLRCLPLLDAGLRRAEPRDGDHERRARHVGHAHLVTELDRRGLAAVLAADADLEVGPRPPSALDADLDQLTDALLVEHGEGVGRQQVLLQVLRQELRHVVPAIAVRHLREVVGPEREELGGLRDLIGDQRRARNLDHRADQGLHRHTHILDCSFGLSFRLLYGGLQFAPGARQ